MLAARPTRRTLITTRLEHSAVREPAMRFEAEGRPVIWLSVDVDGRVDPAALAAALDRAGDDAALVAIHWINNETGTIQDLTALGNLCRAKRVPMFTDATQAIGKIACDVKQLPVDAMSFAGHKLHGPKGVGALYVRAGTALVPQNLGGPHERERRGGTENTPGIVGLGVAAELASAFLKTDGALALLHSAIVWSRRSVKRFQEPWSIRRRRTVCGIPRTSGSAVSNPKPSCCCSVNAVFMRRQERPAPAVRLNPLRCCWRKGLKKRSLMDRCDSAFAATRPMKRLTMPSVWCPKLSQNFKLRCRCDAQMRPGTASRCNWAFSHLER